MLFNAEPPLPDNWDEILAANSEWKSKPCKVCNSLEKRYRPRPDTPHAGDITCCGCGFVMGWLKKPKNKSRRPAHSLNLAAKYGIDTCWLCQRHKSKLPSGQTIEGHHIKDHAKGGTDDPENIVGLCSYCHELVSLIRRRL